MSNTAQFLYYYNQQFQKKQQRQEPMTVAEQRFYEYQLPEIIRLLKENNQLLKENNELMKQTLNKEKDEKA